MKLTFQIIFGLFATCCWIGCSTTHQNTANKQQTAIPPLPPGVTELKFREFFVHPAGPRGLELTEKMQGLSGQRVRILGYMVQQEQGTPGTFLFTPVPMQLHQHEDHCFIDDLPPSVVRVSSPMHAGKPVPFTPGLLLLTGTLSFGNQTDPDGRVSMIRLDLDPEKPRLMSLRKSSSTQ